MPDLLEIICNGRLFRTGEGPRYIQLKRAIEAAIRNGMIKPGDVLPAEREIALRAELSRVTVRKAVQELVCEGALFKRRGSGTFVRPRVGRVEQSLSALTSFTEDMALRGIAVRTAWLDRGVYLPSPAEVVALGLSSGERVVRLARLRIGNDEPLAIERAALSVATLPDPSMVDSSLYQALERAGMRPVRAIQRISAALLNEADAALLDLPRGSAGLHVARTSYLESGKPIEFTRSVYSGDAYDFVAELRPANPQIESEPS